MNRNRLINEIKGLAILAVVVFYLGIFKYGYLGVDVSLVVAGFLTAKSYGTFGKVVSIGCWWTGR